MRSKPYHNEWIIMAICELYFTGGSKSFASCFKAQFLTYQGSDGTLHYEVPMPMVALVSTAVQLDHFGW